MIKESKSVKYAWMVLCALFTSVLHGQTSTPKTSSLLDTLEQQVRVGAFNEAVLSSAQIIYDISLSISKGQERSYEPLKGPTAAVNNVPDVLARLDRIREALGKQELVVARDLLATVPGAIIVIQKASNPSAIARLSAIEQEGTQSPSKHNILLPTVTKAAFEARDYGKADAYASEALAQSRTTKDRSLAGDAIHQGNTIKGRLALARGDVSGAIAYLLASGKTPGSPVLDSFGPSMSLAQDLLGVGERTAVLEYLDECKTFWKVDFAKLSDWNSAISNGKVPNFGANATY